MKKSLSLIICIIMIMVSFIGCSSDSNDTQDNKENTENGEVIKIKLAHVVNEKDGFHIASTKFKELVEKRSDGKVEIEIYPNATLGDERTLLEGMQMGTVDMGVITNGPIANFMEEIAVFELPFLFSNREEAYKILDGPVGKELLTKLESLNLKGLAYAERGFRNLTNSKKNVNTPKDLEGLKIRVMENPVYIDTFKTLGANTVPMAWTETLTALQQGTIDGQENPVNVIYSFKLYETQKYLSMTRHAYAPATVVMSKTKFDKLSKDIQQIIQNSAQEAVEYERQVNAEDEQKQLEKLEESGMEIVYPDVELFKEAVEPVYEKYSKQYGEYIEKIQNELK